MCTYHFCVKHTGSSRFAHRTVLFRVPLFFTTYHAHVCRKHLSLKPVVLYRTRCVCLSLKPVVLYRTRCVCIRVNCIMQGTVTYLAHTVHLSVMCTYPTHAAHISVLYSLSALPSYLFTSISSLPSPWGYCGSIFLISLTRHPFRSSPRCSAEYFQLVSA